MHHEDNSQRVYSNQIHKAPVFVNRRDDQSQSVTIAKEVDKAVSAVMGPLLNIISELQAKLAEQGKGKSTASKVVHSTKLVDD